MRELRAGWLKNDVVRAAARAQELTRSIPCRSKPRSEWCDRDGPGGFMGHTCIAKADPPAPIVVRNLPMPPTSNALFANVSRKKKESVLASRLAQVGLETKRKLRGRVITGRYAAWIQLAGFRLNQAAQKPIVGRVTVLIEVDEDAIGDADSDNMAKAPLDLLVKHGLIEDDNKNVVRETTVRWVSGGGLSIFVNPCTN
jgi:hypothetical protein